MNKTLILVESPTKARTLSRFLGGKFNIEASMGHIRDLPKGKLGVDVEDNFAPQYVIPSDKRKIVEKLKDMVQKKDRVILATDPDREGEAIAFHLRELLKKEVEKKTTFDRIVFHEITSSAINHALESPRQIDDDLVSAQTARRVLDRIVGYNLSPLLWRKIKRNLSGGRVQSVAVRLIVEREREIQKFTSEIYFRVAVVLLTSKKNQIEFNLVQINESSRGEPRRVDVSTKVQLYDGEYKYSKTILDKKKAEKIANSFKNRTFTVLDVAQKETKRSPYPPFITSSLQQEASRRFGFPSRKTMSVAQKLYEEGFITYHRTDSFNLSKSFIFPARAFIEKEFGKKYVSESPRMYKTKSKVAQEAHEAIRPTSLDESSKFKVQSSKLGRDAAKLYDLIYKRAVATQMADAVYLSTKIVVESRSTRSIDSGFTPKVHPEGQASSGQVDTYLFEKNGSVLRFDGFLKLVGMYEEEEQLPEVKVGEHLAYKDHNVTEHTTAPPPRYSEASLIASLEKNGIGRPSTYAPIMSTIQERFYVEKKEGRFAPTQIGIIVNDFLVKQFSNIDDIPFTAQMEESLDEIANGEKKWVPMISEFYGPFHKKIEEADKLEKVEVPLEKTDKKCPECGSDVVIRVGRFGKFYSCSRFPECKYKAPIVQETQYTCPECLPAGRQGGKILVRRTRKGRVFYGCANYPKCKFAVWKLKDLEKNLKAQSANRKATSQN